MARERAAALGVRRDRADDVIDSLADRSLLECVAPGRYRHHELNQALASREADAVEPPATVDRFREERGGRTFPDDPVMVTEQAGVRSAGWEGTPVLTAVSEDGSTRDGSLIDEIVREGARRMLAAALEAEVNAYIAELAHERDGSGRRLVVRNGVGLAMVFKLVESAQARWRAVNGAHLVPLVRAGARFERGVLVERHERAA